jgi:hypothetical protein
MLRLPTADPSRPGDQFALALLADLARVVPASDPAAPAVAVKVVSGSPVNLRALHTGALGITVTPGEVWVPRGLLEAIVEVAGAATEQTVIETDRHDRVPSNKNPLVAVGLEREPVVSQAAIAFREAVCAAAGRGPLALVAPWPEGRRWAAALTHDLDVVDHWPAFTALRLTELIRRGHVGRSLAVTGAALRSVLGDPVTLAALAVLDAERAAGILSTWFVLCETPTLATMRAGDVTYHPEGRRARRILEAVRSSGHEVALHGSFATRTDASRFATQRRRLAALAGGDIAGVRQHYIRMRPGPTHAAMATAELRYDASYGFPDRNGFRLGVADVVPGWDARRSAPSGLDEVPLVWMDRALSKYRNIEDPHEWVADALFLAATCRAVEGLWVGIWHPNLAPALGFPGAREAFESLVAGLTREAPWMAPVREIVAWRQARRAARARGIAPDGRIVLEAEPGVTLEDHHARALAVARP